MKTDYIKDLDYVHDCIYYLGGDNLSNELSYLCKMGGEWCIFSNPIYKQ